MAIDPDFTFSANSLQDYQDCPRRFELKYLLHQSWPALESEPVLEFEHRIQLGSQFHQLVFRYLNQVPQELLLDSIEDADLSDWFRNFLAFYQNLDLVQAYPEFPVRIPLNNSQVLAVFDLIALLKEGTLEIFDWKTARHIPRKETLANRIQTILYPYAALEAAGAFLPGKEISPEKIRMTYLYTAHTKENVVSFDYSQKQHEENRKFLENLIAEIQSKESGTFELTGDERKCKYCVYRSLCERGEIAGNLNDLEDEEDLAQVIGRIDFDAQDEIAF